MKVSELKEILNRRTHADDETVKLRVALPSVGPQATVEIDSAAFGFDWDRGLILYTQERLVPKENNQDVYEAAQDLLMTLATECFVVKKKKWENRKSAELLLRMGHTPEQLEKYVRLFHRDKPIINNLKDIL